LPFREILYYGHQVVGQLPILPLDEEYLPVAVCFESPTPFEM